MKNLEKLLNDLKKLGTSNDDIKYIDAVQLTIIVLGGIRTTILFLEL